MQATTTTLSPNADAEALKSSPNRIRVVDRLFTFPAICMMVVVLLLFGFSSRRIVEPDFWWHLRNGQNILQRHSIPRTDTYTFGAAGSPWLDHEWLSEALYFAGYKAWGLRGVLSVYFCLLVLIYAGLYSLARSAGADNSSALLVTLLAALLGSVSIGPRPLLFGWTCMVALLLILDRFRRTGKGLWLLPPLFALWINLHGSWVFGMVVLATTIVAGLVEGKWGIVVGRRWTPAELKTNVAVFVCSVAALFLNPVGYKVLFYPFDLLFRQSIAMQSVEEWQSVNFAKGSGKLALVTVLGLLIAALFSRRRWRLDEVLLLVFALWTGLTHVRMLFFLGLIMTPILASRLQLFPPTGQERNRPWLNAMIMSAMMAGIVFSFPTESALQQQIDDKFPTAALDFMQRQHMTGRVFNEDWWGGYMEWKTPALKPFMDSRADIFVYNGAFDDYLSIVRLRQPFEVLDKLRIDYVLLEPQQPLVYFLKRSPAWRMVYSDPVAVVLARPQ